MNAVVASTRPAAVIAGAGSGIGAACAHRFVSEGWQVFGWDVSPSAGGDVEWVDVDIVDHSRLHELAESLPPIQAAVNSAGIAVRHSALTTTKDEWDRLIAVNLSGAFYFAQALHGPLRRGSGVLINVASVTAHTGLTERVAYSASKAAVISLTRTLGVEWAADGIRVLSVSPTFVDTPLVQQGVAKGAIDLSAILAQTPQARILQPGEVASSIFRLAGDDFSSVTGSDVLLDGGFIAYGGL